MIYNKSKLFLLILMILILSLFSNGCGCKSDTMPKNSNGELAGKVMASGSTALLPILKPAQEEFHQKHAYVTVSIAGGGSFTGQNQVAQGSVDIGNSDVPLQESLHDKGLIEHKIVGIPFIFITNQDVSINNLTKQQYIDIFSGKIVNWKDVGGNDAPITIIHRAKSSGSRAVVTKIVMDGLDFTNDAVIQDSNGAIKSAIISTPGSIGYVDAAYADNSIKVLAFNNITFSIENVSKGKYPIFTYGRMFTKGEPEDAVKAFIDYVKSKEFQENYAEVNHFIPLSKMPQ